MTPEFTVPGISQAWPLGARQSLALPLAFSESVASSMVVVVPLKGRWGGVQSVNICFVCPELGMTGQGSCIQQAPHKYQSPGAPPAPHHHPRPA